jgi:hypothetical protein
MLLVALLTLSLIASSHAGDDSTKPWHAVPDLSMGSQDVTLRGHCLRFSAAILDSSLARLHKRRLPDGAEFHRGKTVVEQFPDELLVEVNMTHCAAPYGVAIGKDGLGNLQFAAAWRRGSEDRPATILVPHPREDDSQANDTFRTYEISVTSEHTPLTDQLVLTVSSDGKKLADFLSSL